MEPEDIIRTTLNMPADIWRRVKHRAADDRTDLKSVVVAALEAYLKTPSKAPR
jgi:hypothetical protein